MQQALQESEEARLLLEEEKAELEVRFPPVFFLFFPGFSPFFPRFFDRKVMATGR